MDRICRTFSKFAVPCLCLALVGLLGCNGRLNLDESDHALEVEPEVLDFGYVAAGDYSDTLVVEIHNNSATPVEIEALRKVDEGDVFAFHEQPAQLPMTLTTGNSTVVSAYFYPSTEDHFIGWIELVTDADTDGPLIIPMCGCSTDPECVVDFGDLATNDDGDGAAGDDDAGDDDNAVVPGVISVAPISVDFGSIAQNQNPITSVVSIENQGEGALSINSVTITSNTGDESLFTVTGFTGGTVQPGAAPISLDLTFSPGSADVGSKAASLVIGSDDPTTPELTVPLTAEVTEDCGACTPEWVLLDAQGLGFDLGSLLGGGIPGGGGGSGGLPGMDGPQYLQTSTGTYDVRIQNAGSGPGTLTTVTEGGTLMGMLPVPDSPDVIYIGGAPMTLAPGETGTLQFQINGTGCEMVDVDGALSFIMGTGAPGMSTLMDCMDLMGGLGGGMGGLPF